jgi:protein ImuB
MATKAQPRAARAVAELPAACEVAGPPSACAVAQRPAARAAAEPPSARTMAEPPSALPLHRPVWLLPDSLPLAERDALPLLDGQPLQLLAGPERIEAGWWDGATAARDYFIALAADGSLVWVWRSRLPAAAALDGEGNEGRQAQWMLQGRFA